MSAIQQLLLSIKIGGGGGGSEVASDPFTGTNGDPLGANWTSLNPLNGGDPEINTNAARSDFAVGDQMACARWDGAGTFNDNQYSEVVIGALSFLTTDYRCGAIARASANTDANRDFYAVYVAMDGGASKTWRIIKVLNGTVTSLANGTAAFADGDTLRLEVSGTSTVTLTAKWNGSTLGTPPTDSSSPLSTGKPGICVCGGLTSGPAVLSWSGGNL